MRPTDAILALFFFFFVLINQPLQRICAGLRRRVDVLKSAQVMTGGTEFHKIFNNNKDSDPGMDVDMDSSHLDSERGELLRHIFVFLHIFLAVFMHMA